MEGPSGPSIVDSLTSTPSVPVRGIGTIPRVYVAQKNTAVNLSPILEIDAAGTKRWIAGGVLHREDGPAVEWANSTKEWYRNGQFHREDGPAVERVNGDKYWYRHGQRHRDDGPAIEAVDGTKVWYRHDQRHRDDGPAIEYSEGSKEWYLNGQRHRADGPAYESSDGTKEWYLNGKEFTKTAWLREVLKDRPLTTHQRDLLFALSENWAGTPDSLYETATNLA